MFPTFCLEPGVKNIEPYPVAFVIPVSGFSGNPPGKRKYGMATETLKFQTLVTKGNKGNKGFCCLFTISNLDKFANHISVE